MGLLDSILHSVRAEVAEKQPDLTPEQLDEIVEKKLSEPLPRIAEILWPSLQAVKEEHLFHERLQAEMFTKRNICRWRDGFDLMDMLRMISLEIGEMVKGDAEADVRILPSCKFRALVRLHAKALQIFWEIVCLLKHGFADGALGRWRALHEVAVVAALISTNDEDLAQRFLEFRCVESWNSMKIYQEKATELGLVPLTEEEMRQASRDYDKAINRYGDPFRGDYGWAASVITPKGRFVTFSQIERATGLDHLKPYYKWSCEKIHVGCSTLHQSLGLGEHPSEEIMMAGPSNAGHCDPAQLAAISLNMATRALASVALSADVLVGCQITQMLTEQIDTTFFRLHEQLEKEEAEIQSQVEGGELGGNTA